MKLSTRWLARHVDLSGITPEELRADLTLSTCEVEGLERFAPWLSEVTVGYVLERAKHPDADTLSLCKVDVGAGEPLSIVCGAANVAAGQKVAVATIGTVLPGDFKIKRAKIRGQESQGMICSERELDLGDESSGIWVLPAETQVGARLAAALGIEDWVLEIDNKSLTHRPDLWGHRGLAREIAAIYERALKPLDTSLPRTGSGAPYPLRVESPDCPRYLALAIDGARTGRSPDWMRQLLLAVGQRPLDLLVDLSNFVMLDLGQPNHVFDREKLGRQPIVVRQARVDERMRTLDGVERKLDPQDLLICAGEAPVALAGVMGGEESKVAPGTSALLLEVANFAPAVVRRTAARLGLRTDASARFEKSLDPNLALEAAGHFARTLAEIVPEVRFPSAVADAGTWKDPARTIRLRGDFVRTRLGAAVDDAGIADILRRLGFGVEAVAGHAGELDVRVPSFRATKDVTVEQDLVEEIGRIWRYGNVPERALEGRIEPPPPDPRRALVRKLEDRLAGGARMRQTISYSFVDDGLLAQLGMLELPHVRVVNPVAENLSLIRRSVAPSLIGLLAKNRRHAGEVCLFEIGKGYLPAESGEPTEVHELALALAAAPLAVDGRYDQSALRRLQAIVEDVFAALELSPPVFGSAAGPPSWAHPGRALHWGLGEHALWIAELEPRVAREIGLAGELASDAAVAVVPLDALLAASRREKLYQPLPRFPGVKVDVALAVPQDKSAAEVRAAIERAGKGLIASLELFDLYSGDKLGPGKKSLAWHVLLQAEDRTLTDQDAQKFIVKVERAATELGGELRKL